MKKYIINKLLWRPLLYIILFSLAIIVLLPLFWMIITACKQPGLAFKFEFFPKKEAEGPLKVLYRESKNKVIAIFEYNPKDYIHLNNPQLVNPIRVSIAGEFNNWDKTRDYLVKDGNVWSITLTDLQPKRYEYKFVINNNIWVKDIKNPNISTDGNSVIYLKPGLNKNKKLYDESYIKDNKIYFRIRRKEVNKLKIKVKYKGKWVIKELKKDKKDEIFKGTLAINNYDNIIEYKIIQPQSFIEGLKKIYTLSNFLKVINNKDFPFGRFFLNSFIVAGMTALLTVIICTLGGYVFAKKEFIFKKQLFALLLSTMMVPGMIFMVPQFAIVNKFNWINTYQGMIVPHLANIFGLFLLKQYISTIPNSLFEAAIIDGASEFQIFRIIVIPLSLPIMVTLFLMTFVGQWGNFLWQLIVNTPDSPYRTLPVGLALFRGQYGQDWELIMAGACFSIIPIAILFLIAQKFFIEGMISGAIKE